MYRGSRYIILIYFVMFGFVTNLNAQFKKRKTNQAENVAEKIEIFDSAYEALEKARANEIEGEFERANIAILAKDKNDLRALNSLALFHLGKNRIGLAKLILNRAIKSHPKEPSLYNNLGVILLKEGEIQLAILQFQKSLRLRSGYDFAKWNMGSLLLTYRDYKGALSPLEDAYGKAKTKIDDQDRVAFEIASNFAVARAGNNQIEASRKIFEKLKERDSRDVNTLFNYGILMIDLVKSNKSTNRIITKLRFLVEDAKLMREVDQLEKRADKLPSSNGEDQ